MQVRVRHYVDLNILVKLCCALIDPFLTYGILLRGNAYETTLKPIFILQKKAECIITFSKLDKIVTPVLYSNLLYYN